VGEINERPKASPSIGFLFHNESAISALILRARLNPFSIGQRRQSLTAAEMDTLVLEDRCEELRDLSVVNLIVSMYDHQ